MTAKSTDTSQRGEGKDDTSHSLSCCYYCKVLEANKVLKEKENNSMVLGGWREGFCSRLCLNLNV